MSESPVVVRRRRSRLAATLSALVRTRVTAGILTAVPILVTVWIVRLVFGWLRDASIWLVDWFLLSPRGKVVLEQWGIDPERLDREGLSALPIEWQWAISLFSVFLTFFLLYLIGLFAANMIGRRVLDLIDLAVSRMPFIKTIYGSLKQVVSLFAEDQKRNFQRVALVPFPNEITRSVAFITNTTVDALTREELVTVFIPTTPNPTSGYMFLVRRRDVVELDWSVEEAVRIIISGGLLSPPPLTFKLGHAVPAAPPAAPTA